jgi:hypothetical protein
MTTDLDAIAKALAEPFKPEQLKWKPQVVKDGRALALPYVSASDVQNRLDRVLGIAGWRDEYAVLEGGAVMCTLSIRLNGEWIAKQDVGSPSEQPDEGDRTKAAFSDSLKRCAAKWGVGRYLRYLRAVWVEYDASQKRLNLAQVPSLPKWAVPPPAADPQPGRT